MLCVPIRAPRFKGENPVKKCNAHLGMKEKTQSKKFRIGVPRQGSCKNEHVKLSFLLRLLKNRTMKMKLDVIAKKSNFELGAPRSLISCSDGLIVR